MVCLIGCEEPWRRFNATGEPMTTRSLLETLRGGVGGQRSDVVDVLVVAVGEPLAQVGAWGQRPDSTREGGQGGHVKGRALLGADCTCPPPCRTRCLGR